jgi:hypothetical protein
VVLLRHSALATGLHWDRIVMMRPVHLFLPLMASALWAAGSDETNATAQPEGKPACTSAIMGQQWPPEETTDPIFAAALAPYGYPMVCTRTGSTYVWRSKKSDTPARAVAPAPPRPAARKN